MKAYMECRGIAPLILNFGTRWVSGFTLGIRPGTREIGAGWDQFRSGSFGEENYILPLPVHEPQTV